MSNVRKIVLLGHFGVGKTSLVRRYVDSQFSEDYLVTVGVHVKKKDVRLNDQTITLIIWDIEGNNSIEKARSSYLLGTQGFIYVFDVMREETYSDLDSELTYLKDNFENTPVCIVGNKADLFTEDFNQESFRDNIFNQCIFTSAKTGEQVEALFTTIAQRTL